jgi:hypothetical protein
MYSSVTLPRNHLVKTRTPADPATKPAPKTNHNQLNNQPTISRDHDTTSSSRLFRDRSIKKKPAVFLLPRHGKDKEDPVKPVTYLNYQYQQDYTH